MPMVGGGGGGFRTADQINEAWLELQREALAASINDQTVQTTDWIRHTFGFVKPKKTAAKPVAAGPSHGGIQSYIEPTLSQGVSIATARFPDVNFTTELQKVLNYDQESALEGHAGGLKSLFVLIDEKSVLSSIKDNLENIGPKHDKGHRVLKAIAELDDADYAKLKTVVLCGDELKPNKAKVEAFRTQIRNIMVFFDDADLRQFMGNVLLAGRKFLLEMFEARSALRAESKPKDGVDHEQHYKNFIKKVKSMACSSSRGFGKECSGSILPLLTVYNVLTDTSNKINAETYIEVFQLFLRDAHIDLVGACKALQRNDATRNHLADVSPAYSLRTALQSMQHFVKDTQRCVQPVVPDKLGDKYRDLKLNVDGQVKLAATAQNMVYEAAMAALGDAIPHDRDGLTLKLKELPMDELDYDQLVKGQFEAPGGTGKTFIGWSPTHFLDDAVFRFGVSSLCSKLIDAATSLAKKAVTAAAVAPKDKSP